MKPNYGMIQNEICAARFVCPESALSLSLEQAIALEQWMQSLGRIVTPLRQQMTHYSVDRSPMELRLYALFAD